MRQCPVPLFQRTITHITAAAAVVQNHVEVAEMAAATGRADEAAHYAALAERLKAQYHSAFSDPPARCTETAPRPRSRARSGWG